MWTSPVTEQEFRESVQIAIGKKCEAIDVKYCAALRDRMRKKLPAGTLIDVFERAGDLVFIARHAGDQHELVLLVGKLLD